MVVDQLNNPASSGSVVPGRKVKRVVDGSAYMHGIAEDERFSAGGHHAGREAKTNGVVVDAGAKDAGRVLPLTLRHTTLAHGVRASGDGVEVERVGSVVAERDELGEPNLIDYEAELAHGDHALEGRL